MTLFFSSNLVLAHGHQNPSPAAIGEGAEAGSIAMVAAAQIFLPVLLALLELVVPVTPCLSSLIVSGASIQVGAPLPGKLTWLVVGAPGGVIN
jgi:hypothetical protein